MSGASRFRLHNELDRERPASSGEMVADLIGDLGAHDDDAAVEPAAARPPKEMIDDRIAVRTDWRQLLEPVESSAETGSEDDERWHRASLYPDAAAVC